MKVIDFSAGPPSAASIKAAGYGGVILYISDGREAWMTGKNPSREYLDDLDAHGIKFAFVYQYRGGTDNFWETDVARGYDGGYADASEALRKLNDLRCSGHPVIFAVDVDISLDQWNGTAVNYFKGAAAKLGRERVGIYGHSRVIHWAMEDDVVAEVAPGRVLGWQTKSWSNGVEAKSYASLYQHTHGGVWVGGVEVDVNDVWHEDWGWRAIPDRRRNTPHANLQLAPVEYPCDMVIDTPDSGWRDPHKTQATVFHTTENSDSTPPENVANWQTNAANESSYNGLFGADVTGAKSIRTNPENRRSWSAGEPGNTDAIHYAAIGWAARTRAQWLANPRQLWHFSSVAADHHLRYGRPLKFVDRHALKRGEKGFTSHGEWYHGKGGPAYRSDPGDGFPWDVVLAQAQDLIDQGEDMSFTDDDRAKLNRVHHELTHKFDSRYDLDRLKRGEINEDQVYKDTLAGYVLNNDNRNESMHSITLPAIVEVLEWVKGAVASIATALKLRKGEK